MARCGRPSVVGVVALVAGLAAISLLATHASADACASVECGSDAYCLAPDDGPPVCLCSFAGYAFNETSKTCTDPCEAVQCPETTQCVAQDGQAQCQCPGLYIMQNGTCTDGELQTVVQVEGVDNMDLLSFQSPVPMARATGAIACTNISDLGGSITKIEVGWKGYEDFTAGKGMCKSVSFHADSACAEKPGLTIARPAMLRNAFPDTKATVEAAQARSVSCEITTCHKDCDKKPPPVCKPACTANFRCMVVNGKPTCQCKKGFKLVNKKCKRVSWVRWKGLV